MPNPFQDLFEDNKFLEKDPEEQLPILKERDPNFGRLSPVDQRRFIAEQVPAPKRLLPTVKEAVTALPVGAAKGIVYGVPEMLASGAEYAGIFPETAKGIKESMRAKLDEGELAQSPYPGDKLLLLQQSA